MQIEGKVAVVTGAGGGIGRASAEALAARGAAVVVADVDRVGGAATVDRVVAAGGRAMFVATDVSDTASLAALFAAAEAEYGGIDIVHNNAGLVSGDPPWPATPVEVIERVVGVNVLGVFAGTRMAIDRLSRRGGGAIVNTASVAGMAPMPTDAVYAATKAAIILFTQSCSELRASHGIRVNAVLPGMVDTAMINLTGDGTAPAEWLRPVLGMVTLLDPARVADEVVRLVEDDTLAGQTAIVMNEMRPDGPN